MNKTIQDSPLLFLEKELRLISQDALLIFDTKGIIVDVNNTTVRFFGKKRDELIGTPFIDLFSDPVKANNAVEQVFDTGEVKDYELVIETGDEPNTIVAFNISLYKVPSIFIKYTLYLNRHPGISINKTDLTLQLYPF